MLDNLPQCQLSTPFLPIAPRLTVEGPALCAILKHGGDMARYTVHVDQSHMAMGLESPLTGLEAYTKVCELRAAGFAKVTLRNVATGEEITDVASLVLDSPDG